MHINDIIAMYLLYYFCMHMNLHTRIFVIVI